MGLLDGSKKEWNYIEFSYSSFMYEVVGRGLVWGRGRDSTEIVFQYPKAFTSN